MTGLTDDTETSTIEQDKEFLTSDTNESTDTTDDNTETTTEEPTEEPVVDTPVETPTETPQQNEEVSAPDVAARAKEIATKYPEVFKTFPELRKALFQHEFYSRVFPTVELAKEAAGRIQQFEALSDRLIAGDPGDLLDSIYDIDNVGPKAVSKLIENFLPTVLSRSESLWRKAIDPVFRQTLAEMRAQGKREGNKNLEITANNLSQWLFGKKDVGPEQRVNDPEKIELQNRLQAVAFQQEEAFVNGLFTEIESTMMKDISSKLPTTIPGNLRDLLAEKVLRDIRENLKNNKESRELIERLGIHAKRAGFTKSNRDAILNAYLRPARALINSIAAKHLNGLKGVNPAPRSTGGEAPSQTVISGKKVDWSKTSDKDFLADKITYRK